MNETKNYFILTNEIVREHCIQAIKSLPYGYEVVIRKKAKQRTTRQNRFYFGPVLECFSNWMGDTKDNLHKLFKVKFLGVEKTIVDGVELVEPKSSADLTVEEFGLFLDKVSATALTLGITLPTPEYHGVEK